MSPQPDSDSSASGQQPQSRHELISDAEAHDRAASDAPSLRQDRHRGTSDAGFALRARPRPVQSLRRRRIIMLCGILAFGLMLTLAAAFDPPKLRPEQDAAPIGHQGGLPQSIQDLPRSYGEIRTKPQNISDRQSPPTTAAAARPALPEQPIALPPARSEVDQEREAERKRRLRQAQQAREAGVFFARTRTSQAEQTASAASGRMHEGAIAPAGGFHAMPAHAPAITSAGHSIAGRSHDLSGMPMQDFDRGIIGGLLYDDGPLLEEFRNPAADQLRKSGFLQQPGPSQTRNRHRLEPLTSPYQLLAGHVIEAALVTGIHSDLPGLVKAQVTAPVYDSVSGDHLLVPPGAQLLGRYDSVISHGQSRVLVVWHRLILPDGSSMTLEPMSGSDGKGQAGLQDEVDFHGLRLGAGVALASLLGVAAELTFGEDEDVILRALRRSAQRSTNRAGQRLTERNLNIQPTITIRPGWPVTIMVTKDLLLRAWAQ